MGERVKLTKTFIELEGEQHEVINCGRTVIESGDLSKPNKFIGIAYVIDSGRKHV